MALKKRAIIFLILLIGGFSIILMAQWNGKKGIKTTIINVEGFDIEYDSVKEKVTKETLGNIELGSSISEISDILGNPDMWIGSGMLRPVYFGEDNTALVLHFGYPAVCEDLRQIILYRENGESEA